MLPKASGGTRKRDKLFQGFTSAAAAVSTAASSAAANLEKPKAKSTSTATEKSTAPPRMPKHAAVDITEWNLYGRDTHENGFMPLPSGTHSDAVVLVGPIVGAVTDTTARVLIEVASMQAVTMEAFMGDESVCAVSKEVAPKTPTAFQLDNFEPGRNVNVVVSVGGEVRRASFTTTKPNKLHWKIATVSCNCHTHTDRIGLWGKLAKVASDVDCVLHLGDQIYGDSDFGTKQSGEPFESAWHASLTLLEPLERQVWSQHKGTVREFYRNAYRTTWNMPDVARVLASTANYMICDDHEFTDDLGDLPEHSNPSSLEFYVATLAYQVYNEYQHQLLEEVDVTDRGIKPYYAHKLSPRVGFFMTDNRVERSLHRAQATKAAWEDRLFMGPAQWDRVTEAFASDFADCEMVIFGTPTPLVFLSQKATGAAKLKIDDAQGTWGAKTFENEQKALTKLLTDWQNEKDNRVVVTVGGDVHMGGFTDSWHNGSDRPLHQMTASAIGNEPEGGMTPVREAAIRGAMHADENLFDFKVRHHGWIYGPNLGMMDFSLTRDGDKRPHTTLTLVPGGTADAKIRNLQIGDSSIVIDKKDQSRASRQAYETAELMAAVAPHK